MHPLTLLVLLLFSPPWTDSRVQQSAGHHPRSYLLVADTLVKVYRVKVTFEPEGNSIAGNPALADYEYLTELAEGRIGLTLPPEDARAMITIVPESEVWEAALPYAICNRDAYAKIFQSDKGYFDTHCFKLRNKRPKHP
jgi:hypothetical protein